MSAAPRLLVAAPIDVRWGDMDAFGHVNNSVYATYLEEARLRWFATIDGGWQSDTVGPVVAAQAIDFRAPVTWPSSLVVELVCERVGHSSLTLAFRMHARDDARTLHADGTVVMVWIDRASGKSTALPDGVRRAASAAVA